MKNICAPNAEKAHWLLRRHYVFNRTYKTKWGSPIDLIGSILVRDACPMFLEDVTPSNHIVELASAPSRSLSPYSGKTNFTLVFFSFFPVTFSQRALMTSVYTGDFSMILHRRPSFIDAMSVLPEPPNGSSTRSSRLVSTLIYGIRSSNGFVPKMIPCPLDFSSAAM